MLSTVGVCAWMRLSPSTPKEVLYVWGRIPAGESVPWSLGLRMRRPLDIPNEGATAISVLVMHQLKWTSSPASLGHAEKGHFHREACRPFQRYTFFSPVVKPEGPRPKNWNRKDGARTHDRQRGRRLSWSSRAYPSSHLESGKIH